MARAHTFKDFSNKIDSKIWEINIEIGEFKNMDNDWYNSLDDEKKIKEFIENFLHQKQQLEIKKESFYDGLNMWTFDYPILMAADIIGYDVDVVPVGKDQLQHLEMARDIARYVNHHYEKNGKQNNQFKPILVEPKAIIDDSIAVIPGLDGRKMSKSYNNYISMFESSADLKKKIATIPTDTKTLEEPKDPETCNVFAMIKTFWEKKEIEEIRAKYKKGGYGYGHAKQDLHVILDRFIAPYRDAYTELNKLSDEELFEPVRRGNAKMQKRLDEVLARMKQYIGV